MLEEAGTQTCQDPGALLWSGIGWKDIRFREESKVFMEIFILPDC